MEQRGQFVCVCVCVCVCVYVCWSRSWAMQKRLNRSRGYLGGLSWVGLRNYVLNGGADPQGKGAILGEWRPIVKYSDTTVNCAETAEPIEMPFGWRQGPRKHVLDAGPDYPREVALLRGIHPIGKHCNSELCKNSLALTCEQYTDGKLLPSAIYRCLSLGDRC